MNPNTNNPQITFTEKELDAQGYIPENHPALDTNVAAQQALANEQQPAGADAVVDVTDGAENKDVITMSEDNANAAAAGGIALAATAVRDQSPTERRTSYVTSNGVVLTADEVARRDFLSRNDRHSQD